MLSLAKEPQRMPIYEFRCLACNDCFEILVMKQQEQSELRCPKCSSEEFERVISRTCYAMGAAQDAAAGPQARTRSCSAGSCTTWELPGHSR
jgi:putative FmdB family regulatory protein